MILRIIIVLYWEKIVWENFENYNSVVDLIETDYIVSVKLISEND